MRKKWIMLCIALLSTPLQAENSDSGLEYLSFVFRRHRTADWSLRLPQSTSNLPADAWGDYAIGSAFDGDMGTAWAEGEEGSGVGEIVAFEVFPGDESVGVLPGFGVAGTFERNHRVKQALVSIYEFELLSVPGGTDVYEDSCRLQTEITFDDRMSLQKVEFAGAMLSAPTGYRYICAIEILGVYPGNRYDDTCIAEIRPSRSGQIQTLANVMLEADSTGLLNLLATGTNPDVSVFIPSTFRKDSGRTTPLFFAAQTGNEVATNLLLDYHANPNLHISDGDTPLIVAVRTNREPMIKLLIRRGANPNYRAQDAYSPLYIAVSSGRKELVSTVLLYGANPNIGSGPNHDTPLHAFVEHIDMHKNPDGAIDDTAFGMLIEAGASISKQNYPPNHVFTGGPRSEDLSSERISPFHHAIVCGEIELVRLMLDSGADPTSTTYFGVTPVDLAQRIDDPSARKQIVDMILQHREASE